MFASCENTGLKSGKNDHDKLSKLEIKPTNRTESAHTKTESEIAMVGFGFCLIKILSTEKQPL